MKFLTGGTMVGSLTITGMTVLQAPNTTSPAVTARAVASMTADLQSWETSTGAQVAYLSPSGYFSTVSSISSGSTISAVGNISGASAALTSTTTGTPNLTLRAVASQTAPMLSVLNATGGTLGFINVSGVASFAGLSLTTTALAVASGGTNSTATPTSGGVAYGNGSSYLFTAAGAAGQVLGSNAAGAPTWQTLDLTYLPGSWAKKSVRAATTANITLSAPQTIDGIAVVAGDRVLVKNQTTASQNGIYVVAAAAWTRPADADTAADIASAVCAVDTGTALGGTWFTTSFKPTDTLGTTSLTWYQVMDASRAGVAGGYVGLDSTGAAVIAGPLHLSSTADANNAAGNSPGYPPLVIGSKTGQHLRLDNNEIISMSKDDGSTGSPALGSWGFTGTTMGFVVNSVNITGQAAGSVPLNVKGFNGQTANIFQVQSATATNFMSVAMDGSASFLGQVTAASGYFTGTVTASNLQDSGNLVAGLFTVGAGWTTAGHWFRQFGPVIQARISLNYTGATVTAPASGDIANQTAGTIAAGYRPSDYAALQNIGSFGLGQFYINSGGALALALTSPNASLANGASFTLVGTWMVA